MKRSTLHKMWVMLLCVPFYSISIYGAIAHGSIKGTAVPFYAQGTAGGNLASPVATEAATLDYKVVTKGSKSWVYMKFNGTAGINIGAAWQIQFRYWSSTNAKTENNMTDFRDGVTKVAMGSTVKTIPAPLNISFFQDLNPGGFSETALIAYDVTAKNSPVAGDVTTPTVTACDVVATETTAALTLTGSDDSGDVYYHIADEANGIDQFALNNTYTLTGLTASTSYNLTITPIDFTGNEGTPLQKSFVTGGLVQVTYGIAKEIKFRLKSTATQLEYYYEFVDPTKKFRDAFIKITPSGGSEFELKPTLSPDSTYAYGKTTDANIANKILSLNCGYFIYVPGDPVWENYVVDNKVITDGDLNGTPIKHQMGGAIQASQFESTTPVLNGVSLQEVNSNYAKLNLNGSDNSGAVYYTITGGKQIENAFRTGDYFFTSMDPGKVYDLSIQANDFSGNASSAIQQKLKTMKARTNIQDGNLMKYNTTLISPTGAANELAAMITVDGNAMTIGCNTSNVGLTGTALNKKFFNPTVKIDGTSYPLTLSEPDSTLAQFTFSDVIGSTQIASGSSFTVQFSVFWAAPYAGNFFTGTFSYTIGDNGQTDNEGPSAPALSLTENTLSWPACSDFLSGVKWYTVAEAGQPQVKIFDFGESSFNYLMTNPSNQITVTAVDFVGNSTETHDIINGGSALPVSKIRIFPNPATDRIYIDGDLCSEINICSLQGQILFSRSNTNVINVSALPKGLYILCATDKAGNKNVSKIEIR